jgi:hypothetical protein
MGRSQPRGFLIPPGLFVSRLDQPPTQRQLVPMPDLAEPPPTTQPARRTWFTAETAADAARKSHAATSARNRIKTAALAAFNPEPQPPQDTRLALLSEQIARTRDALNGDDLEPHHRAALLRALCELLDKERIAKGEPLPGSRRPAPAGKTMAAAPAPARGPWVPEALPDPAPVAAAAPVLELPAAPARPMGWEYDG